MAFYTDPATTKNYLQGAALSIISQRKIAKKHSCQGQAIKALQSFHCELQESCRPVNTLELSSSTFSSAAFA